MGRARRQNKEEQNREERGTKKERYGRRLEKKAKSPGEEEAEAVDAKVGRSGTRLNKVEVGASVKEGMSAFASGSSHNTFSILTLSILLLVNHRLAL